MNRSERPLAERLLVFRIEGQEVHEPLGGRAAVVGADARARNEARLYAEADVLYEERFRLYPQTRNIPFFVLIKDAMKDGERLAMSRQVEHLVRKKELSKEEFLTYFRRRG